MEPRRLPSIADTCFVGHLEGVPIESMGFSEDRDLQAWSVVVSFSGNCSRTRLPMSSRWNAPVNRTVSAAAFPSIWALAKSAANAVTPTTRPPEVTGRPSGSVFVPA